ncbi:hypothetical protein LTR62_003056 [Meristemomyces frigidus]|uniref:LNS2/PITP domain-containing protein n=1 Tax=Meristemomyces frigidus TaxID=1508187 RepID=A0AAN7TFB8_9PEZI|nr:hypothetical protein LTR62_003056 [Meristemomyces frigidus]
MQYVRSISGSLSSTWNSINPATLSGAIDVIVVEQEDGSLACSPFHIRFGKFSLLRPYEKKVEFRINGAKVDYPMKLGEGGEAFFVFETLGNVPEGLRTSPLVSPVTSPQLKGRNEPPSLEVSGEPELLELDEADRKLNAKSAQQRRQHSKSTAEAMTIPLRPQGKAHSDVERLSPLQHEPIKRPSSETGLERGAVPRLERLATDSALPTAKATQLGVDVSSSSIHRPSSPLRARTDRSGSPAPPSNGEAKTRAMNLSKKLWTSNISNQVTESGDLMLDMTGFKSSDREALHAEVIARQLLSEELDGPYDIGALIGADEKGNVWIYSSEEAKEAAGRRAADGLGAFNPTSYAAADASSDPGYHSDDSRSESNVSLGTSSHLRRDSDSALGMASQPSSPGAPAAGDPNKNYAKTLRLTSEQLKTMSLNPGANPMAFTVNRATCHAVLWYWQHSVPIVISDIDGTITKSDVLGQVLNSIGRDWTHQGVAKLYTEIAANGYNFMYLTSRSVGQADTTRAYLDGVQQDGGYKLPRGPTILSPDRTIAALRREIYLRKPEIFKMACLRDVMALFAGHGGALNTTEGVEAGLHTYPQGQGPGRGKGGSPFYAGFGNRLTDALSYRSVNIPSTRIFTINSNSEISLDLLSLNKYKTAYGSMREIVDHYFPPVGLLVKGGGEEFTDFNYWREKPMDLADFTDSEDEDDEPTKKPPGRTPTTLTKEDSILSQSILSEDEGGDDLLESYLSDPRYSLDERISEVSTVDEEEITRSMLEEELDEYGDDEMPIEEPATAAAGLPTTPDMSLRGEEDALGWQERTPRGPLVLEGGKQRRRSEMMDESDRESVR